jgi:proline racemase
LRFSSLITAVDAHACGEPGRVITGGVLDVPGKTMFEKMKHFERHADHIRLRMFRSPDLTPVVFAGGEIGMILELFADWAALG